MKIPQYINLTRCKHDGEFSVRAVVERLTDKDDKHRGEFIVNVQAMCIKCGRQLTFAGPEGLSLDEPTVSTDGQTARLPARIPGTLDVDALLESVGARPPARLEVAKH